MGRAVCAFLTQCAPSGWTCRTAINCVKYNSPYGYVVDKDFLCALMQGCAACKTELCGADGKPSSGHVRCDMDGDNDIDCDDLKLMIELLKACNCANGVAPPTTADIVALACLFYGKDGCLRNGEGSISGQSTVYCVDIAECLEQIADIPVAQFCAIMHGTCPGQSSEPGCTSQICTLLTSTPDWDAICAELGRHGLEELLRVLMCCSGAESLTDDQLATILCAIADHCGLECSDVARALYRLFGYTRGKKIFDKFRACHAGCNDFDDELFLPGARKRNSCKRPVRPVPQYPPVAGGHPVEWATGEKTESATDLIVDLPGGAFTLTRSYSSELVNNTSWTNSVFGAEWTIPVAQFIMHSSGSITSATWVELHGESANEYRRFNYDSGSSTFKPDTGEQSYVELLDEQVLFDDGTTTDWAAVWRLTEPGIGTREYIAGAAVSHTTTNTTYVSEHTGVLFRETSIHGRRNEYVYSQYGTFTSALRPDTIYLAMFGSETRANARARVVFSWSFDTATKGRLERIDLLRPSGSSDVLTNQVEYRYKKQDSSEPSVSNDVGMAGDLIQVVTREITDSVDAYSKPVYRSLVTQYRYHRGGSPHTGSNTLPLLVDGAAHQLKAVLMPEQIEYLAQKLYATGPGGNQPDTVESVATALLANADSDTVLTGSETRSTLDIAAKVIGYQPSGDQQVAVQFLQASCGCGGAAQGVKETYEFLKWTSSNPNDFSAIVREYTENGSGGYTSSPFRVTRCDLKQLDGTPYLLSKAISASISSGDGATWWIWGYHYDSNKNLTHEFMPSAIASYSKATTSGPASFTANSTGLVNFYAYNSNNRMTERRVGSGDSTTASTYTLIEKTTYYTLGGALTSYLPSKLERYRWSGSTAADDVETTDFDYGFRTLPDLAWVKTTYEAELTSENGPGGSYYTYELINSKGQTDWTRAEDFAVRGYTYDNLTGAVLTITGNADPSGINTSNYGSSAPTTTGWGNVDGGSTRLTGGTLTTTYTVDLLGRPTSTVRPAGSGAPVTVRTVRQMLAVPDRQGVLYYTAVDLPHKWTETSTDYYAGPASLTWENASGKTVASADYSVTFSTSAPGAYTLGTQLSKSTVTHSLTGVPLSNRRWRSVADGLYDTTALTYDARGNVHTKTEPTGTISRYTYDLLDRVVALEVGTSTATSGGNMKTVSQTFYDFDTTSSGSPAQGIGDGNPTLTRLWFGDGSSDYRDYLRIYDVRNRLVQVRGARDSGGTSAGPHEIRVYDNLGRLVEQAMYGSLSGLSSAQGGDHNDDITASASSRSLYSRVAYTQRGLNFRMALSTSPTLSLSNGVRTRNTTALTSELVRTVWLDGVGRVLGQAIPNSAAAKNEYDGHGRVTRAFVTDRDGATVGSSSDQIIEQTNYTYDDRDRVALISRYLRRHDDTSTGPLDAGGVTAVKLFAGRIYDGADRIVKNVNLGTNVSGNATLTAAGAAPSTWPPATLPSYPDAIIESRAYNARGLTAWVADALGHKIKYKYDDLNRQVAVIENATLDPDTDITWSGTLGRWVVSGSVLSSASPDQNRVCSTVYDASGNVERVVAHKPGATSGTEAVQITQYIYGTTAGSASTPGDSLLASNNLLREVRYPQESGTNAGQPGGATDYNLMVRYAYNRLGELRSTTDQNGTRHDYNRDVAGRITLDSVGAFGTDIDTAVQSIAVSYDSSGRLRELISASNTSGTTPVNGLGYSYTALWQPLAVYQNHSGAAFSGGSPATGTKSLSYSYATATYSGGTASNYSRLDATTYPDNLGPIQTSYYSGIDDRISRVTDLSLNLGGLGLYTSLADYKWLGLGNTAVVDYSNPDVQLDYTFSHSDRKRSGGGWTSQTVGTYPGYDGFGRIARQTWLDGNTGNTTGHNHPAIIEHVHSYDAASNRLSKLDGRTGASGSARDYEYTYDGLNRLSEAKKGVRGTSSWTVGAGSQQWVLDMLGNWVTRRTDLNGNGVYTDTPDRSEARDHNEANELSQKATTTNGTTVTLPLVYNDAGQMRTEQTASSGGGRRYTHDAWGRLVKVEQRFGTGSYLLVAQYSYNGLHWRIDKALDADGNGVVDRRVAYWYDASWRVVQEDHRDAIDDNTSNAGTFWESFQQVWGPRYIDDAVGRIQLNGSPGSQTWGAMYFQLSDAQFSVCAVLDDSGVLVERNRYTPYGETTHTLASDLTANGVTDSSDYDGVIYPLTAASIRGSDAVITDSDYNADADINRDGVINSTDYYLCEGFDGRYENLTTVSEFQLTVAGGPRNDIGYCGYVANEETQHYLARFRHYSPQLGRWLERDPLGYVDGANLYSYLNLEPTSLTDPEGLAPLPRVQGTINHPYPLYLGGCPSQDLIDLESTANHQAFHDSLTTSIEAEGKTRCIDRAKFKDSYEHQRAVWKELDEATRQKYIEQALKKGGMSAEEAALRAERSMKGAKPGTKRTGERSCGRGNVFSIKGKILGGILALVAAHAVTQEAAAALSECASCRQLFEGMNKFMRTQNCSELMGVRGKVEDCLNEIGARGADAGMDGNQAAAFQLLSLTAWDELVAKCQEAQQKAAAQSSCTCSGSTEKK